jgi:hypothetical protein
MFTQEKGDQVCALLAEGSSLRKAAAACGVSASHVLDWTKGNAEFGEQYARARARGYELLADEIIEISDDASHDVIQTEQGEKPNTEFVARSRLRVDSRKWMLAKMLPKVYGDKIEATHELGETFTKVVREIVRG